MTRTAGRQLAGVLSAAVAGDEIAFRRIIAAYHEDMRRVAAYVAADHAVAEEATQAAWLIAWRKLGNVRDEAHLRPWLISVAANEAKRLVRKQRRRAMFEAAADAADEPGGVDPATGIAISTSTLRCHGSSPTTAPCSPCATWRVSTRPSSPPRPASARPAPAVALNACSDDSVRTSTMDDMSAFERQAERRIQRFVGPVRPVDDLAVFDAVVATSRSQGWSFSMWSAVKFVAAAFIVALFGGFLLAGVLTSQQGDEMAPAAVPESPAPATTDELLSGMVTKEVEPSIFRVDHDSVRDLSPAGNQYLDVGQDGSIWLASYSGDLSKLGVAETHRWQLRQGEHLKDLAVASDGKVWAVVLGEELEGSTLRSFDGERWTTHAAADTAGFFGDVEIAPDGVIWAVLSDRVLGYLDTDGSEWQTVETPMPVRTAFMDNELGFVATESGVWVRYGLGVWHYADGSWEQIPYRDPDTGAMPEGVFWGIGDETALYRHDATGWQHWSLTNDRMLASWSRVPHGVAPDGSFWAAWPGRGALGTPDCLGVNRFDGRAWERYLPDMYVHPLGMDIAPDGSVWLIAWEDKGVDDLGYRSDGHLYVITPEAVAATSDTPSPMAAEELLAGMVTEEFESGVYKIVDHGVGDVDPWDRPPATAVVAGQDGSIWRWGSQVGSAASIDWQLEEQDFVEDFEVAPDGTVWAIVSNGDGSALRSFDGETWAVHGAVDFTGLVADERGIGHVEMASNGRVWAAMPDGSLGYLEADSSTWQTIEMPPALSAKEIVESPSWMGVIATDSDLWAPNNDGFWHYADGTGT